MSRRQQTSMQTPDRSYSEYLQDVAGNDGEDEEEDIKRLDVSVSSGEEDADDPNSTTMTASTPNTFRSGLTSPELTESRSFVNGLLSPFSPLLKQKEQRDEFLKFVSLAPCRKVSVIVRVLPTKGDDEHERRCLFPHLKDDQDETIKKPKGPRDMVVVNPTAFGKKIPSQVTMETAKLVAQIAQIPSEDWARLYEFHHVMWPPPQSASEEDLNENDADLFSTMETLCRAVVQDALVEQESSLLLSMGQEPSCMGTEDGLWPKIVSKCQAWMDEKSVCTLTMVELSEEKDHYRDLLDKKNSNIQLRHVDMKGAIFKDLTEVPIDSMPALLESVLKRKRIKNTVIATLRLWNNAVSHQLKKGPDAQITCVELAAGMTKAGETIQYRKSTLTLGRALRQLLLHASLGTEPAISYRETTLTKVLQRSMESSKIVLLASVSQLSKDYESTLVTLNYLRRLLVKPGKTASSPFKKSPDVTESSAETPSKLHDYVNDSYLLEKLVSDPRQRLAKVYKPSPGRSKYAVSFDSERSNEDGPPVDYMKGLDVKMATAKPKSRYGKGMSPRSATAKPKSPRNRHPPVRQRPRPPPGSPPPKIPNKKTPPKERERDPQEQNRPTNIPQSSEVDSPLRPQTLNRSPESRPNLGHPPIPRENNPDLGSGPTNPPYKDDGHPKRHPYPIRPNDTNDENDDWYTPKRPDPEPGPGPANRRNTNDPDPDPGPYIHNEPPDEPFEMESPIATYPEEPDNYPPQQYSTGTDSPSLSIPTIEPHGEPPPLHQQPEPQGPGPDSGWHSPEEEKLYELIPEVASAEMRMHPAAEEGLPVWQEMPEEESQPESDNLQFTESENEPDEPPYDEQSYPQPRIQNELPKDDWPPQQSIRQPMPYPSQQQPAESHTYITTQTVQQEYSSQHHSSVLHEQSSHRPGPNDSWGESRLPRGDDDGRIDGRDGKGMGQRPDRIDPFDDDARSEDFLGPHIDDPSGMKGRSRGRSGNDPPESRSVDEFGNPGSAHHEEDANTRGNEGGPPLARYVGNEPQEFEGTNKLNRNLNEQEWNTRTSESNSVRNTNSDDAVHHGSEGNRRTERGPGKSNDGRSWDGGLDEDDDGDDDDLELEPQTEYDMPGQFTRNKKPPLDRGTHSTKSPSRFRRNRVPGDGEPTSDPREYDKIYGAHDGNEDGYESRPFRGSRENDDTGRNPPPSITGGPRYGTPYANGDHRQKHAYGMPRSGSTPSTNNDRDRSSLAASHDNTLRRDNRATVNGTDYAPEGGHQNGSDGTSSTPNARDQSHNGRNRGPYRSSERQNGQPTGTPKRHTPRSSNPTAASPANDRNGTGSGPYGTNQSLASAAADGAGGQPGSTWGPAGYNDSRHYPSDRYGGRFRGDDDVEFHDNDVTPKTGSSGSKHREEERIPSGIKRRILEDEESPTYDDLPGMGGTAEFGSEIKALEEAVQRIQSMHSGLWQSSASSLHRLKDSLLSQQQALKHLVVEREELLSEIDSLRKETKSNSEEHQRRVQRYEEEVEQLQDSLNKVIRDKDAVERIADEAISAQDDLERRLGSVENDLNESRQEVEAGNNDYLTLEQERDSLKEDLDATVADRDQLRHDLDELQKSRANLRDQIDEMEGGRSHLEDEYSSAKGTIERLENQLRLQEDTNESLESEIRRLKKLRLTDETNLDRLKDRCNEIGESLSVAEKGRSRLEQLRHKDQLQIEELRKELQQTRAVNKKLKTEHSRCEEFRVETTETIKNFETQTRELRVTVDTLRTESSRLEAEVFKHTTTTQTLKKEISSERQTVKHLESEVRKLSETRRSQKTEIQRLQQRLREEEKKGQYLDELEEEVVQRKEEKSNLEADMLQQNREHNEAMRQRDAELERCKGEMERQADEIAQLQESGRSISSRANEEMQHLRKSLDELETELTLQNKQNGDLSEKLDNADELNRTLSEDLKDADRQIERLRNQAEDLKSELSNAQEQQVTTSRITENELRRLRDRLSDVENDLRGLREERDDALRLAQTESMEKASVLEALSNTKDEILKQRTNAEHLTKELDNARNDKRHADKKIFNMEAALRRFRAETKQKVGRVMNHQKDSEVELQQCRQENKVLHDDLDRLTRHLEKLERERDACFRSLEVGRDRLAMMASRNFYGTAPDEFPTDHHDSEYENNLPPTHTNGPTMKDPKVQPELYLTDYSAEKLFSLRAEEIAAYIAMSARTTLQESQDEASHLRSQVYRLEEEKESEVASLKAKINSLQQELAYADETNLRRRQKSRARHVIDPAD